jgi:hypothetical protein
MPICQKCQTPYDEWQHFCLECGEYLKEGPPPLLRCPKCGAEVEIKTFPDHEAAAPAPKTGTTGEARSWRWFGVLAAVLLGVGLILLWQEKHGPGLDQAQKMDAASPPEAVEQATPLGEGEGKTPMAASPELKAQVEELFDTIKQANLGKNIVLFMNTLSGVYPELDKKRQEVVKTWKKFDFKEMSFKIDKLQEIDRDKALAEMKWTTKSQNLRTKVWRTEQFQYRVWLVNELGQWKIRKIEQIPH